MDLIMLGVVNVTASRGESSFSFGPGGACRQRPGGPGRWICPSGVYLLENVSECFALNLLSPITLEHTVFLQKYSAFATKVWAMAIVSLVSQEMQFRVISPCVHPHSSWILSPTFIPPNLSVLPSLSMFCVHVCLALLHFLYFAEETTEIFLLSNNNTTMDTISV
jgi:hypothetical protein